MISVPVHFLAVHVVAVCGARCACRVRFWTVFVYLAMISRGLTEFWDYPVGYGRIDRLLESIRLNFLSGFWSGTYRVRIGNVFRLCLRRCVPSAGS